MGFTAPDPTLLDAWTLLRRADRHVDLLLDSLQDGIEQAARALGGQSTAEDAMDPFVRTSGGRAIHRGDGDAYFRIRVPAQGQERLRVGLRGWQPPLRAFCAFLQPTGDDPEERRLLDSAAGLGYRLRRGSRFLYRPIDEAEKSASDLPEAFPTWVEEQIRLLTEIEVVRALD
jgi:hypothetical protein